MKDFPHPGETPAIRGRSDTGSPKRTKAGYTTDRGHQPLDVTQAGGSLCLSAPAVKSGVPAAGAINRGAAQMTPVMIRQTLYPSIRAAANALGVHERTVSRALDDGRIDEVGLHVRRGRPAIPCTYKGKEYPSMTAAAKACNVSLAAVSRNCTRQAA
jgi:NUMOD1 domain